MAHFADPHRCPDCSAEIVPGQPACSSCELPLAGELAQQLYRTLVSADALLLRLRETQTRQVPASPADAPGAATPALGITPEGGSSLEVSQTSVRRTGMSAASVPKILLGLGAACVLVAALVFLAVTWSVMGVGGRTATLFGLTLVSGLVAAWLANRDLRGGAEAMTLVALGLLTLDVFGARDAGWFGDLPDSTFMVLVGTVLVLAGAGIALMARRTPVAALTTSQVVAGIGTGSAAIGVATLPGVDTSVGLVAAVLLAAAAVLAATRLDLSWTSIAAAVVTGLSWLTLLGHAIDRAAQHQDLDGLWLDLHVWPLLAAAALVGALALVAGLAGPVRVAAAMMAYAVLTLALVIPVFDEGATATGWVAIAALAAAAAVTWLAPLMWRPTGLLVQASAGLLVLAYALGLCARAGERLVDVGSAGWSGTLAGRLPRWEGSSDLPAPWLLPLLLLALLVTLSAVWTLVPAAALSAVAETVRSAVPLASRAGPRLPWRRIETTTLAILAMSATVVAALSLYPVPVWAVVVVPSTLAAGFLASWLRTKSTAALVGATVLLAVAVTVSGYDDVLMGLTLTAVVVATGVVHLRATEPETSAIAGGVLMAAIAGGAWTWSHVAGLVPTRAALTILVVLAVLTLPVHLLPSRTWAHPGLAFARAGLEVGAAAAALPTALAGVLMAPVQDDLTWTAVYLTVAGVSVTALALLRPDRLALLPVGGALLAAASWVRLWEVGIRAPEPYTLPSAAVLAAAGLWFLHGRPESSTAKALSPALALALVPSLLWALDEGPGPRALLLGLACLALVVAGTRLRWTAPMTWGAVVGGLLVARLAAPYLGDAVPRWALIFGAGAILITMGVTWERRLQEARQVVGYVRALR
ncbi:hypothetical protein BH18ACT9_BH18ACT9_01030 [soil metagenome]